MPQMAPMNWLMIMIFLVILLLTISSLNYFTTLSLPKKNNKKKMIKLNWKL